MVLIKYVLWYIFTISFCVLLLDFISCRGSWCSFSGVQGQSFDFWDSDLSVCYSWHRKTLTKLTWFREANSTRKGLHHNNGFFFFLTHKPLFVSHCSSFQLPPRVPIYITKNPFCNLSFVKQEEHLDNYLNLQGLDADQCWRSKDGVIWNKSYWNVEMKHVVSLVELVFKNAKTFDKLVVLLNERCFRHIFEDLVTTFSHNNNVFISLSTDTSDAWWIIGFIVSSFFFFFNGCTLFSFEHLTLNPIWTRQFFFFICRTS